MSIAIALITALALQSVAVRVVETRDALTDAATTAVAITNGRDELVIACGGPKSRLIGYVATASSLYTRRSGQISYRFGAAKPVDELWSQSTNRAEIDGPEVFAVRLMRTGKVLIRFHDGVSGPLDVSFPLGEQSAPFHEALGKVASACNAKFLASELAKVSASSR